MKIDHQKYYLEMSVNHGEHVPLVRPAFSHRYVLRGMPETNTCFGYVRNAKSNQLRSYVYQSYQGWHPVTEIEECDEILRKLQEQISTTQNGLQKWIEYRRGLQKMLVEINNIPNLEDTNTLTWTRYKRLKAKQNKAESVFYGILSRLDSGGRQYKNDGQRMHKASADMKKYEKLAKEILCIRENEYYFEWGDGMCNSGCGVCHYTFTPPPPGKLYGNSKTIQLGTGSSIGKSYAYIPQFDINKEEKSEDQCYCFIRTKGDLAYVKKNLLAWINRDLKQRRQELKRLRESLLHFKCMRHETELEQEYLSSPKLQKKEKTLIEQRIKANEEKAAQEYAARPRWDAPKAVKLWDGEIHWQCGKCQEKNVSHDKTNSFEEECHSCWEINRINLTKELVNV